MVEQRLEALRKTMKSESLFAFIVPDSTPHADNGARGRWAALKWLTDDKEVDGLMVVTMNRLALWTDSDRVGTLSERLSGADVRVATRGEDVARLVAEWLQDELEANAYKGSTEVGIDGMSSSWAVVDRLIGALRKHGGMTLRTNLDPFERIWDDRPKNTMEPIEIRLIDDNGRSLSERVEMVRRALRQQHADGTLMAGADDVAWVLDGKARECGGCPLPPCYLLVEQCGATLYVDSFCLKDDGLAMLGRSGVRVEDYAKVGKGLEDYFEYNILIDPEKVSYALVKKIKRPVVTGRLAVSSLMG